MRFIHAAPGLTVVDFGLGSLASANYQPIFTGVTFGTAGGQGEASGETVDPNGYVLRSALRRDSLKDAVAHAVEVSGRPRREVYARALELARQDDAGNRHGED